MVYKIKFTITFCESHDRLMIIDLSRKIIDDDVFYFALQNYIQNAISGYACKYQKSELFSAKGIYSKNSIYLNIILKFVIEKL